MFIGRPPQLAPSRFAIRSMSPYLHHGSSRWSLELCVARLRSCRRRTIAKIYLVLNDYGDRLGRAWAEVPQEDTGGESVIRELMTGQHSGPVRIIAFNTAERWSRDVSEEIAEGVSQRLARRDEDTPAALEDFIARHGQIRPFQLPLLLRGSV